MSKIFVPKPISKSIASIKPHIAITLGDPAGIGPEIVSKALRDPRISRVCQPIVIGKKTSVRMGHPSRAGGRAAIDALNEALALMQTGRAEALVTAPVSKEAFRLADHGFPGHTEWLAAKCHAPDAAMLMVSGPLRAILMTRHVRLSAVSKHLTKELIIRSAQLGYAFIQNVVAPAGRKPGPSGLQKPRLVLCGLNPHAGDHGIIGQEEQTIFLPALRALKKKGILVAGPLPSDTVFLYMADGRYDLALAAYHDQGMIPLKLYSPHQVVNVTLGLPFIRTSPGHGTAYNIAGKGKAHPGSMIEAILLAARYAVRGWRSAVSGEPLTANRERS